MYIYIYIGQICTHVLMLMWCIVIILSIKIKPKNIRQNTKRTMKEGAMYELGIYE